MKQVFTLFICFITQITFAQNTLKGTITDKSNKTKLSGAAIYITELNKSTASNDNGEYAVTSLGKGDFKIQVSYLGYQTKIVKVNLSGKDVTLDIEVEKATIEVNEVAISGAYTTSQDESPQEIDVVRINEMQKIGASTIMDAISKVSGVSAVSTGPLVSRPVIRGLSGNRILTVVDGVRFETQQWDDEHGIGVNELGIDRVEVIKGPSTLLYGPEAMGGVIHLIEEQPAAVGHIVGDVRASSYSNNFGFLGNVNTKGATDKYNWSFATLAKSLPDYYSNGYSFRTPNTRLSEMGAKGSFGINRNWGSTTLSYMFNRAFYGILDGKDIKKNPDGSIMNTDVKEKDMFPSELEAPYHAVKDNKISSKTILLAGESRFQLTLGYQNNQRTEFEDNGTKVGYEYVGMTLQSSTYDLKWFLPTFKNFSTIIGVQGMYQTNKNSSTASTQLVPDATINDIGFVGLTKYNLGKLNFTAGGRYDSRNLSTTAAFRDSSVKMPAITRSYSSFSGAVGATYDIEEHLLLRANYATGYRAPNLNELMADGAKLESRQYEIGNTNFLKEQNNEIDVSAILRSKFFTLELAVYLNNITNFIYVAPTGNMVNSNFKGGGTIPEYQYLQANARLKGGEVGIDIHPPSLNWIHLEVKAANLKAIRTNDNSYLPMMPANKIYNTLVFNFSQYKAYKNIFARVGTVTAFGQNDVALNELTTSDYTLLNVSVGATRKIWKINNIDISLAVNNAFDRVYLDNMSRLRPFGIANPGRNVVLSLRIPFDVKWS